MARANYSYPRRTVPSPLILQCHDLRPLTVNHATITHDPRSQLFLTAAEPIVEFVFPRNWLFFETIAHPRNSHRFVFVIAREGRKEGVLFRARWNMDNSSLFGPRSIIEIKILAAVYRRARESTRQICVANYARIAYLRGRGVEKGVSVSRHRV